MPAFAVAAPLPISRAHLCVCRCYSNRAACHLLAGEFEACVEDCSEALRLMQWRGAEDADELLPVAGRGTIAKPAAASGAGAGAGAGAAGVAGGAGGDGDGDKAGDDGAQAAAVQPKRKAAPKPTAKEAKGSVAASGPIPARGTERYRAWIMKTLVRRGSALARLKRYDEGRGAKLLLLWLFCQLSDPPLTCARAPPGLAQLWLTTLLLWMLTPPMLPWQGTCGALHCVPTRGQAMVNRTLLPPRLCRQAPRPSNRKGER